MATGTLLVLDAGLPGGLIEGTGNIRHAQSMTFTTIVLFSLFTVFNARRRAQRVRRAVLEFLGVGRLAAVGALADGRHSSAALAAGIFDRRFEHARLADLCGCWKLHNTNYSTIRAVLWLVESKKLLARTLRARR